MASSSATASTGRPVRQEISVGADPAAAIACTACGERSPFPPSDNDIDGRENEGNDSVGIDDLGALAGLGDLGAADVVAAAEAAGRDAGLSQSTNPIEAPTIATAITTGRIHGMLAAMGDVNSAPAITPPTVTPASNAIMPSTRNRLRNDFHIAALMRRDPAAA